MQGSGADVDGAINVEECSEGGAEWKKVGMSGDARSMCQ